MFEQITPILLSGLVSIAVYFFTNPKSKLIFGTVHSFNYLIPDEGKGKTQSWLFATSILIQNSGRAVAEKIELVLDFPPQHFEFNPTINFNQETKADNRFIISIEYMAPLEFSTLHLLGDQANPTLVNLKYLEGKGIETPIQYNKLLDKWKTYLMLAAYYWGLFSFSYLVLSYLFRAWPWLPVSP